MSLLFAKVGISEFSTKIHFHLDVKMIILHIGFLRAGKMPRP